MVVGEVAERVDLLVIGGGAGGHAAALRAAELGAEVVLVEQRGAPGLGGAHRHAGVAFRALRDLADQAEAVRRHAGGLIPRWRPALEPLRAERGRATARMAGGLARRLTDRNVTIVAGAARFNRPTRVAVRQETGAQFIEFDRCVIATGSRPRPLAALPVDGERILDWAGALAVDTLPGRTVVIGGGPAGVELATAYAKLGVQVTVVESGPELLAGIDRDLVGTVLERLRAHDLALYSSTRPIELTDDGLVVADEDGARWSIPTDTVVVAAGRVPNTDDLGLRFAGIPTTATGHLAVDARCLIRSGLAAVGDVTPGPAVAHRAGAQAVVAAEALLGHRSEFDATAIPSVVFSDPQIATTGLTLDAARRAGVRARAVTTGGVPDAGGLVRLVVDTERDVVIGAQVVCAGASEVISEVTLAIELAASPWDLALTVHPHQTSSEYLHAAAVVATTARPHQEDA